jgi:hypothetical protein
VTARIRAELGNKLGGCLTKRVFGVFVQHLRLRILTVFMVNYRKGETFVLLVVFQQQRYFSKLSAANAPIALFRTNPYAYPSRAVGCYTVGAQSQATAPRYRRPALTALPCPDL